MEENAGQQLHRRAGPALRLRTLRMNPSELCGDDVFVRRAYLDLLRHFTDRGGSPVFRVE